MDRRSWLLLSLLSAIWGASYLFIKVGLDDLSPPMVVFVRTLLGALTLLPLAISRGILGGLRGRLTGIVLLAAVQVAGPFLLISMGEEEISSGLAGILVASAPIFTALLAVWVDQSERSSGWNLVGIAVGVVGVAVLLGVDTRGEGGALVGGLLVVLAGLGYAIGGFMLKRGYADVPPVATVTATLLASSAMILPAALATAPDSAPAIDTVAAMLALGAGGTGIGFVIFYTLIATVGPTRALLVSYIAPGFAVVYGVILLDERVTWGTLVGLVLVLSGSWLAAEGRRPALSTRRSVPEMG